MKKILNHPVLNFIFFSYLLNATWEWMQSPFFIDTTSNLNLVVWYRIHCSLGDTLILLVGYVLISLYRKDIGWVNQSRLNDYLILVLIGFFYTILSEFINVHVKHNWAYSRYMPIIPFINTGVVPLLQWIILPPVILSITRKQVKD